MQQENITTNKGKYSPLKIFSYPVNPHHRESMRSCRVNTGGLPQQRNWTTSDPRATYFKIKFKSKNIKSKEKAALSRCCKEQYSIGTWNVGSMNQGKLEVAKQEMASVNVDILGISELQ